MYNIFDDSLMAVIPSYLDDIGNVTIIYRFNDENIILKKSIKSTVTSLGKIYAIDLKNLKLKYRDIINSTNLVPIPLDFENILIPIKTRQPICKNDGAFSYVNLKYINTIKKDENKSLVILKDGRLINSISSFNTSLKHYYNGKNIKDRLSMEIMEAGIKYKFEDINKILRIILDNKLFK